MRKVSEFPEDFQQLLLDLLCQEGECELPEYIGVDVRNIEEHREEFLEDIEHWTLHDFEKMRDFTTTLVTERDKIPPVIVSGSLLRDGYHRVGAMYLLGIQKFEVIDLNDLTPVS